MAAVQDVSHLPTTSKGCLEGGTGRLPPWPALLPSEANARVICRSLCCGRGTGPGSRAPGPTGTQACRPLPQTVSLSLTPKAVLTLCSGWGPLQLLSQSQTLETIFWLLLCPTVLTTWQSGLCSRGPVTTSELPRTSSLLPWTPFDSGPHSSSWNKAQDPTDHPRNSPSLLLLHIKSCQFFLLNTSETVYTGPFENADVQLSLM